MTSSDPTYEYLLKDIVINLHHSTETLFKYLVQQHNPYLIYADINNYFKQELDKGWNTNYKQNQYNTIQFLDAIHCVLVAYSISIEKDTYNRIKKLNEIRNELTHFTCSFQPNVTENHIAFLLPELFKIYNTNIPNFAEYAEANGLYNDAESLADDAEIWGLNLALNFLVKWDEALLKIDYLAKDTTQIAKIFDNKKTEGTYMLCPCCGKEMLYVTSSYIAGATDMRYLGICDYCQLSINEQDCSLFAILLGENEQISELKLTEYIKNILCQVLFVVRHDKLQIISKVLKSNRARLKVFMDKNIEDIVSKAKTDYIYFFDEVCETAANDYFDEHIYQYNDVVEKHVLEDNTIIHLDFYWIHHYIQNAQEDKSIFNDFKIINKRISSLSKKTFNRLFSLLPRQYITFCTAIYHNWDGDEIDYEFDINIEFSKDDLKEFKRLIS